MLNLTRCNKQDGNDNLQNYDGYVFGHDITTRTAGNYKRIEKGFTGVSPQ